MQSSLNLARLWRSKTFNEIIGQDLSIRMLKNSLYIGNIFPVYLFAGQRGCGKTTTARVLAAALNCAQLLNFQKNPKTQILPCLDCVSCQAMLNNTHPDFIEIDAASHTGVDNVRMIIDAAALLPTLGTKKIYLIDEAHMLSKAAFNAFLKILEEPPTSVVFMLATTDAHKVLDTVRSRCFQLFFHAIDYTTLVNHLTFIAQKENITTEQSALYLIAHESEGSARDAINLLEQVRFAYEKVTYDDVITVLGHMPEHKLLDILQIIIEGNERNLLLYFSNNKLEIYTAHALWSQLYTLIRAALYQHHGVALNNIIQDMNRLINITTNLTPRTLTTYLELLYQHELILIKTTSPHQYLEIIILLLCNVTAQNTTLHTTNNTNNNIISNNVSKKIETPCLDNSPITNTIQNNTNNLQDMRWIQFITDITSLSDPLLVSIFKQSYYEYYDEITETVHIIFTQDTSFFKEWIHDTCEVWEPLLKQNFGEQVKYKTKFQSNAVSTPNTILQKTTNKELDIKTKKESNTKNNHQKTSIDITSDPSQWTAAHSLINAFGGTLSEVMENDKKIE